MVRFVTLSPLPASTSVPKNCSCCDDVTKTDINIASVPCLLEARNTNKKRRLQRKSCASPSGCGAVRARRKTSRQSEEGSERMQPNRSCSSRCALTASGCRCLPAPIHISPGFSAKAGGHVESGEAKIFGCSGRSGALHPGRVTFCRL